MSSNRRFREEEEEEPTPPPHSFFDNFDFADEVVVAVPENNVHFPVAATTDPEVLAERKRKAEALALHASKRGRLASNFFEEDASTDDGGGDDDDGDDSSDMSEEFFTLNLNDIYDYWDLTEIESIDAREYVVAHDLDFTFDELGFFDKLFPNGVDDDGTKYTPDQRYIKGTGKNRKLLVPTQLWTLETVIMQERRGGRVARHRGTEIRDYENSLTLLLLLHPPQLIDYIKSTLTTILKYGLFRLCRNATCKKVVLVHGWSNLNPYDRMTRGEAEDIMHTFLDARNCPHCNTASIPHFFHWMLNKQAPPFAKGVSEEDWHYILQPKAFVPWYTPEDMEDNVFEDELDLQEYGLVRD